MMNSITPIDTRLLDATSERARHSPRRRQNHNFHRDGDASNRLLNAIAPASYVQPHRHCDAARDETMVAVRGKLALIVFAENGSIIETCTFAAGADCVGVNIPHGTWHTVLALEPGSVFFEAKAGPYQALTDADRAPWAPAEGTPAAAELIAQWRAMFR